MAVGGIVNALWDMWARLGKGVLYYGCLEHFVFSSMKRYVSSVYVKHVLLSVTT